MFYQVTYSEISKALYLSLRQDLFYIEIENSIDKDPGIRQEAMLKYFDFSMKEAQKYGELYIPENNSFGASVWSKPMDNVLSKSISLEKKVFIMQQLGENCARKYTEIIDFMSGNSKEIIPVNSWYLSIVGVDPQLQGQGLGVKLIKPVLDKADKIGVPSYLETFTSRNKKFYNKLGYKDAATFYEPVIGAEYWIMFREPLTRTTTSQQ